MTGRRKPREKTRERIIRLVLEDPVISMEDLASAAGITPKRGEWQIAKLKKQGIL